MRTPFELKLGMNRPVVAAELERRARARHQGAFIKGNGADQRVNDTPSPQPVPLSFPWSLRYGRAVLKHHCKG
jgi:hypothetical protein